MVVMIAVVNKACYFILKQLNQMRSTKELLQVMLNNQKEFRSGLCQWSKSLYYSDIITCEEASELISFIEANRPSKDSSLSAYIYRNRAYY